MEPCRILLSESVAQRMAEWSLPSDVRVYMEHQLREVLGRDPVAHLRRVRYFGLPHNVFAFSTVAAQTPTIRYDLLFQIVWGDDEASLCVLDGGFSAYERLTGDP